MSVIDVTQRNLTSVAEHHGYKTFYKLLEVRLTAHFFLSWVQSKLDFPQFELVWDLCRTISVGGCSCKIEEERPDLCLCLQDTGVMDLLKDGLYQPLTAFLPSDGAMAALPQEQKDFLFHQDNRPQLVEYLKYHFLQSQKVSKTRTPRC